MADIKQKAFFIRGFARSGTNWLGSLINLHPEIQSHGEFQLQHYYEAYIKTKEMPYGLLPENDALALKLFESFVDGLIRNLCGRPPVFGDRTPIRIADCLLPDRKYVVIHRDPRDVLVSFAYHFLRFSGVKRGEKFEKKRKVFNDNPQYFEDHKNELLDEKSLVTNWAREWNNHVLSDKKVIENYVQKEAKTECYFIKYEDLHVNPEVYRKEIYKFLGVNPLNALKMREEHEPGVKTEDVLSHNRRALPNQWGQYITDEQHSWIMSEVSEGMEWIAQMKSGQILPTEIE